MSLELAGGAPLVLVALVELGGAEGEAADDEPVEVGVCPAECGLEDLVELGEIEILTQEEQPPDGRLSIPEEHPWPG